jgi:hypothetical protein
LPSYWRRSLGVARRAEIRRGPVSRQSTPCFRRLAFAFAASHSTSTGAKCMHGCAPGAIVLARGHRHRFHLPHRVPVSTATKQRTDPTFGERPSGEGGLEP